jgi:hypothetical protein
LALVPDWPSNLLKLLSLIAAMELQHINVKVFFEDGCEPVLEDFINTFHTWIQADRLDELLVDVADYRHVRGGPDVLLVAREADYCIESSEPRRGLVYNRKAVVDGSPPERIGQAMSAVLRACRLLESEHDDVRFSRQHFEVLVNDRGRAPNTTECQNSFQPELEKFLVSTFDGGFSIERESEPRRRLAMRVQLEQPYDLDTVIDKLS